VAELARSATGRAAIVMGDLNTADTAPVLDVFRTHGFVDLFRTANPQASGATVWQRLDAPAPTVVRRVDYVFLRASDGLGAEVAGGRVVLNTPRPRADGGLLWPSDHYGVFVEVGLVARPTRSTGAGERAGSISGRVLRPSSAR
jgi:endonuclease/exonuclease/phosphatase family metal-dependent hydrolase